MKIKHLVLEVQLAFSLLTTIPIPAFNAEKRKSNLASCIWVFPLVGVVLGLLAGSIYYLSIAAGLNLFLSALISVSTMVLLTGALHEDGLADVADGFGGGYGRDQVLNIMSDSSIGTYGTLALLLVMAGRVGAVYQIEQPQLVITALISAASLGRTSCLFIFAGMSPARQTGLGHSIKNPGFAEITSACILCLICNIILFDFKLVLLILGVALIVTLIIYGLARSIIGGFTGDVIGASLLLTELAVLVTLAVSLHD